MIVRAHRVVSLRVVAIIVFGIETTAARLAAIRRTDADLTAMRIANDDYANHDEAEPEDALVEADLRFHRAIVEASHNVILVQIMASVAPLLREHRRQYASARERRRALGFHRHGVLHPPGGGRAVAPELLGLALVAALLQGGGDPALVELGDLAGEGVLLADQGLASAGAQLGLVGGARLALAEGAGEAEVELGAAANQLVAEQCPFGHVQEGSLVADAGAGEQVVVLAARLGEGLVHAQLLAAAVLGLLAGEGVGDHLVRGGGDPAGARGRGLLGERLVSRLVAGRHALVQASS